jgi:periplasmic divalent cation tolerance protein
VSSELVNVSTSVGTAEDARRIATEVVRRRLAACAQISSVDSCYSWKGELQTEREYRIEFKTTPAGYAAIEAAIRELHPYELPDIHAVAVDQVFEPYASWVEDSSSG